VAPRSILYALIFYLLFILFFSPSLSFPVPTRTAYALGDSTHLGISQSTYTVTQGQSATFTANLTDTTTNSQVSGALINFYYNFPDQGPGFLLMSSCTTGSQGTCSVSPLFYDTGQYYIYAAFAGSGNLGASSSNTIPLLVNPPNSVQGWGNNVDGIQGFTANEIDNSGNWQLISPFSLRTQNNTGWAAFVYFLNPLSVIDFSEMVSYVPQNTFLNYGYTFSSNFTLLFDQYVFEDLTYYNNGFYGIGANLTRDIVTRLPNGSTYNYSLSNQATGSAAFGLGQNPNLKSPLRFVFYNAGNNTLVFAWTFTPAGQNNIAVQNGIETAFAVSNETAPTLGFYISFNSSPQIGSQGLTITLNQAVMSQNTYTGYYTLLQSNGTGGELSTIASLVSLIWQAGPGAVATAIKNALGGFASFMFNAALNFLRSIGFGIVIDALYVLFSIAALLWDLLVTVLPIAGFILLLINLFYVVQLDFEGLFTFWYNMYQIFAMIINALLNFVQTIVDVIQALTGSGSGGIGLAGAVAGG
jgi:hypothetical protein